MLKKNAAQMVKKIKDLETQLDSLNKQMEKEDNLQDEPLLKKFLFGILLKTRKC